MKSKSFCVYALMCCLLVGASGMRVSAQGSHVEQPTRSANNSDIQPGMTNQRLAILIERLDPDAEHEGGYWRLRFAERDITVITDEGADRMRILAGVTHAENLSKAQLYRLMQANFDSALDARYSIAKSIVWSTYLHPLSPLTDEQFLLAMGQVINLANTYGSTFSSGALIFGGGDSGEQQRQLIQNLMEKGLEI